MMLMVFFGFILMQKQPRLEDPFIVIREALITTKNPGMAPERVERLITRVIEEQARGDPSKAQAIRAKIESLVGGDLAAIRPGSDEAMALKKTLIEQGAWSQYLEVGIGPDAEIFTKCAPMASVGVGADIGILRSSTWNNPEPEVVLIANGCPSAFECAGWRHPAH